MFSSELEPSCGILLEPSTFASHLRCSTQVQQPGRKLNMYNARGRLQLMHLSCSQGGVKTLSDLSSPCNRHFTGQRVARVCFPDWPFQPNVSFLTFGEVGVWGDGGVAQALYKSFRLLFSLKIFILLNKSGGNTSESGDNFCCFHCEPASRINLIQWHFVDSSLRLTWVEISTKERLHCKVEWSYRSQ